MECTSATFRQEGPCKILLYQAAARQTVRGRLHSALLCRQGVPCNGPQGYLSIPWNGPPTIPNRIMADCPSRWKSEGLNHYCCCEKKKNSNTTVCRDNSVPPVAGLDPKRKYPPTARWPLFIFARCRLSPTQSSSTSHRSLPSSQPSPFNKTELSQHQQRQSTAEERTPKKYV